MHSRMTMILRRMPSPLSGRFRVCRFSSRQSNTSWLMLMFCSGRASWGPTVNPPGLEVGVRVWKSEDTSSPSLVRDVSAGSAVPVAVGLLSPCTQSLAMALHTERSVVVGLRGSLTDARLAIPAFLVPPCSLLPLHPDDLGLQVNVAVLGHRRTVLIAPGFGLGGRLRDSKYPLLPPSSIGQGPCISECAHARVSLRVSKPQCLHVYRVIGTPLTLGVCGSRLSARTALSIT
jgi:hypothetical protein